MDQQRVEVVQVAARLEEGSVYAPYLRVTLQKGVAEGVEEADEGQFDLRVGVIEGGIQESGYAIFSCQHVGAPDVAVDERRRVGVFDELIELLRQALHPKQILHRQASGLVGEERDIQQAVVAKKLGPALPGRVRLA